MIIVDSQVHIWNSGKASPHHVRGRPDPFTLEDLQAEMREAGVDCAVLAPPTWEPPADRTSQKAAEAFPDRFAVTDVFDWRGPPDPSLIRNWCERPGMFGLRLIFNTPEKQQFMTDGSVDWIWSAAEQADLPVMLLIPGAVPKIEGIAHRYPGLRLCIDHLGIPRGAKDDAAFEHLPDLLALARYPNVSVKSGGSPTYSTVDEWPYPSLHGHLRKVYDAFGPERIFWASDVTRMSCPYREVVTMYTEGIPWLSQDDKRLIMGEAVCRWLGWSPAPAADG